ncbi:hypothetical protein C8J55DRAFT_555368 [Lentinula edodes]|uniref:Uncharacterized protein n=1 Tax=Lentinula lateritia TaxID=40482 RepID=A0A9W9AZ81_9AGAR|nr:hypothetical protein C8J55DRAFT_555368 [Lentinula edodes]
MSENRSLSLDKGVTAKHSNTILRLRGGSSTTTQPPRPINIDYAMLLVNTLGLAAAAAQLGVSIYTLRATLRQAGRPV